MGVPAGSVYMADNVVVSYLPDGFSAYGGYYNGPYANMTALKRRFPKALLVDIAVRMPFGTARCADAEPGTLSSTLAGNEAAVLAFLKGYKGSAKPIVYTMGSWAQSLVAYLTAHGVSRTTYILWTAHYNGLHICGPHSCGILVSTEADGTQYATGHNDFSVFKPGVLAAGATGGTHSIATTGVKLGDTDANTHGQVHGIQNLLNAWAKYCGFAPLIVDGDFGAKVYNAVRLFQEKRKVGLTVDGVVGPETLKYLQNPPGVIKKVVAAPKPAPKPSVPSGNPSLKQGDSGKAVAAMQYYLRNSGLVGVRGINADGDFGPQTVTALKNFQRLKGLTQDGVYGPATAKALSKVAVG